MEWKGLRKPQSPKHTFILLLHMDTKSCLFWSQLIFNTWDYSKRTQPPMKWPLPKISSLNLIKPLDSTTNFQGLQRREEQAPPHLGMLSAKFRLWDTLQDKWTGFSHKQTAKKRKRGGEKSIKWTRLKGIPTNCTVWILFGSWFKQIYKIKPFMLFKSSWVVGNLSINDIEILFWCDNSIVVVLIQERPYCEDLQAKTFRGKMKGFWK